MRMGKTGGAGERASREGRSIKIKCNSNILKGNENDATAFFCNKVPAFFSAPNSSMLPKKTFKMSALSNYIGAYSLYWA